LATWLPALLIVEAFVTAQTLAQLLPSLGVYPRPTQALIAGRTLIAVIQVIAAMKLRRRAVGSTAVTLAALVASAALRVVEIGWRLAPTSTDPTFRWWIVGGYSIYVVVAVAFVIRSHRRSA